MRPEERAKVIAFALGVTTYYLVLAWAMLTGKDAVVWALVIALGSGTVAWYRRR